MRMTSRSILADQGGCPNAYESTEEKAPGMNLPPLRSNYSGRQSANLKVTPQSTRENNCRTSTLKNRPANGGAYEA